MNQKFIQNIQLLLFGVLVIYWHFTMPQLPILLFFSLILWGMVFMQNYDKYSFFIAMGFTFFSLSFASIISDFITMILTVLAVMSPLLIRMIWKERVEVDVITYTNTEWSYLQGMLGRLSSKKNKERVLNNYFGSCLYLENERLFNELSVISFYYPLVIWKNRELVLRELKKQFSQDKISTERKTRISNFFEVIIYGIIKLYHINYNSRAKDKSLSKSEINNFFEKLRKIDKEGLYLKKLHYIFLKKIGDQDIEIFANAFKFHNGHLPIWCYYQNCISSENNYYRGFNQDILNGNINNIIHHLKRQTISQSDRSMIFSALDEARKNHTMPSIKYLPGKKIFYDKNVGQYTLSLNSLVHTLSASKMSTEYAVNWYTKYVSQFVKARKDNYQSVANLMKAIAPDDLHQDLLNLDITLFLRGKTKEAPELASLDS